MPAKPNPPAAPRGKSGLLAEAAGLLYGPNYIIPLATMLGRDRRTVRRWLQHEHPIPAGVWDAVEASLTVHKKKLHQIAVRVSDRTIIV